MTPAKQGQQTSRWSKVSVTAPCRGGRGGRHNSSAGGLGGVTGWGGAAGRIACSQNKNRNKNKTSRIRPFRPGGPLDDSPGKLTDNKHNFCLQQMRLGRGSGGQLLLTPRGCCRGGTVGACHRALGRGCRKRRPSWGPAPGARPPPALRATSSVPAAGCTMFKSPGLSAGLRFKSCPTAPLQGPSTA